MLRMDVFLRIWRMYPIVIDLALYFFVFAAAARVSFSKAFPGHEGKVLSMAVGLFLAVGLAMAQRTLGFSTESMGPVAAIILCGIVFIASYKFLHHAQAPVFMSTLLSLLLALALARAAMPETTNRFLKENPLVILLAMCGLLYWAWHKTEGFAKRVDGRRPGNLLAQHEVVPSEKQLRDETKWVKKRMKRNAKQALKEEQGAEKTLEGAVDHLEKGNADEGERGHVLKSLEDVLEKARHVRARCQALARFDRALRRYDWKWLRKQHGVSFSDFTPEQKRILKRTLDDERRRMRIEEALERLIAEVDAHVGDVQSQTEKAKACIEHGSSAGAAAWLLKALASDKRSEELEKKILEGEKWLMDLLKRQRKDLVVVRAPREATAS